MHGLPPLVGAIGLAAVFSAEVSAADAVLFMLTTSLSQDLYRRFANPTATDRQVLRVSRWTSIAAAGVAFVLAIVLGSVVNALTIFYTLLTVVLFVPIVGGLFVARTDSRAALASIATGVIAMLTSQAATGGRGWSFVTPALTGLVAAIVAWLVMIRTRRSARL
jgi:SSS family solute:Na+ symporter